MRPIDASGRIADVFQDLDWLDFSNLKHRNAIEDRLNQNRLAGLAVKRWAAGMRLGCHDSQCDY
jgi:hypothetical protein